MGPERAWDSFSPGVVRRHRVCWCLDLGLLTTRAVRDELSVV